MKNKQSKKSQNPQDIPEKQDIKNAEYVNHNDKDSKIRYFDSETVIQNNSRNNTNILNPKAPQLKIPTFLDKNKKDKKMSK